MRFTGYFSSLFRATWMDLDIIMLSEVSQTEKDKCHMISFICGIQKKSDTNKLIYRTEIDSQTQKTNCGYQRRKAGWGGYIKSLGLTDTQYYV